jgi:hypothetical protein
MTITLWGDFDPRRARHRFLLFPTKGNFSSVSMSLLKV